MCVPRTIGQLWPLWLLESAHLRKKVIGLWVIKGHSFMSGFTSQPHSKFFFLPQAWWAHLPRNFQKYCQTLDDFFYVAKCTLCPSRRSNHFCKGPEMKLHAPCAHQPINCYLVPHTMVHAFMMHIHMIKADHAREEGCASHGSMHTPFGPHLVQFGEERSKKIQSSWVCPFSKEGLKQVGGAQQPFEVWRLKVDNYIHKPYSVWIFRIDKGGRQSVALGNA